MYVLYDKNVGLSIVENVPSGLETRQVDDDIAIMYSKEYPLDESQLFTAILPDRFAFRLFVNPIYMVSRDLSTITNALCDNRLKNMTIKVQKLHTVAAKPDAAPPSDSSSCSSDSYDEDNDSDNSCGQESSGQESEVE